MLKYTMILFRLKRDLYKCDMHHFARISEAALKEAVGKHIKVQGWVRSCRHMKQNSFVDLSDGTTSEALQVVVSKSLKADNLGYGSSIVAEGELQIGPNGAIELHASDLQVIGKCDVNDGYPFAPRKKYSSEYVRQYLHLRPRTRAFSATLRLRDLATSAIANHFRNRGFINIHTPILTSNDSEGAGEIFTVKPESDKLLRDMKKEGVPEDCAYFDSKAYLTVSGQLHLEAVARALTKVYSFGPTFRAENSKSRLHLSEFYMIEAEVAFITSVEQIAEEVELLVKNAAQEIVEKGASDLRQLGDPQLNWLNDKFGYTTYDEAFNYLENHSDQLQTPIENQNQFTKEQELFLVKRNNNVPLFVVNWPKESKPFYMKECVEDPSKVAALDLLAPTVGELVGGSVREDDYKKLEAKLPPDNSLSWYLQLRKYGNVTTGGFGMGFERFLQCVLGISNIKDTLPFPRWPHNCTL